MTPMINFLDNQEYGPSGSITPAKDNKLNKHSAYWPQSLKRFKENKPTKSLVSCSLNSSRIMPSSNRLSVVTIIDPDQNEQMSRPNKEYLDLQKQKDRLLNEINVYERRKIKSNVDTNYSSLPFLVVKDNREQVPLHVNRINLFDFKNDKRIKDSLK